MKIRILMMLVVVVGCGDYDNLLNSEEETTPPPPTPFRVFMEYPIDENGYYHFNYPKGNSNSYGEVYCETLPTQRIHWYSPNTFDTYYQQQWFSTPIIQYSTYTSSDGIGKQLFYLYEIFVGDTLTIVGGLSEDNWDYVEIIID